MKTGLSTCHGLRSFHARCCCSARSANSACSLSSFAFILTASAADLSSISDDTLASTSDCILTSSWLFYASSAVCSRRWSLSYTALSRQALKASGAPRGTASSLPTQFAALWMVIRPSTPRKRLYFVSRLPFLPFAHAKLLSCVCRPSYAFCPDVSLLPNLMKSSGICFSRCHKAKLHVVGYFYLLHNMIPGMEIRTSYMQKNPQTSFYRRSHLCIS